MDNQNNVALANTVNGGGLRVGETNVGAFVGSALVAGKEFDWNKLYSNLSYVWSNGGTTSSFPLVIANLSSNAVLLQRDGDVEEVAAGKIDWYTIGNKSSGVTEIQIFNEDANGNGTNKRILEYYSTMKEDASAVTTNAYNRIAAKGELIFDHISERYNQFSYMCFIFDN
jgi:hypothetical protein